MLKVIVLGDPQPKGSMKCVGRNGRHQIIEDDKTGARKTWRARLTSGGRYLLQQHGQPLTGAIGIDVRFSIARPAGHYRTGRHADQLRDSAPAYPTGRGTGDVDKLARMLLDALQDSGLFADDAQVVNVAAAKEYATAGTGPGATIHVWSE